MTAPGGAGVRTWSGAWVTEHLGLDLRTTASPLGLDLADLLGLAVRRNPRRPQLLVSRVLGKHVPTDPRVVRGAALLLGDLVREVLAGQADRAPDDVSGRAGLLLAALDGDDGAAAALAGARGQRLGASPACDATPGAAEPVDAVVLGYAETATALGHGVADALGGAPYLHSTRRRVPGIEPAGGFEEEHSHATTHLLLPADPSLLAGGEPLVLVDDELSTGRTIRNTVVALHRRTPRRHYVVATLVDLRGPEDRAATDALATELGARIDVVALASGHVVLPEDASAAGAALVARFDAPAGAGGAADAGAGGDAGPRAAAGAAAALGDVTRVPLPWPADLPETGRHGVGRRDRDRLGAALPALVEVLAAAVAPDSPAGVTPDRQGAVAPDPQAPERVLVLGTEELMDVPLLLAAGLAELLDGVAEVRFSSTTRSPVLVVPDEGYAIRSALRFRAHDAPADGPGPRFAYNAAGDLDGPFGTVVLVVDEPGDTAALDAPDGPVAAARAVARHVVVVRLPDAAARLARGEVVR